MIRCIICAVAIFVAGIGQVWAAESYRVPCWIVKAALASHDGDRNRTRQAARARGYSEADIAEAERRCLK